MFHLSNFVKTKMKNIEKKERNDWTRNCQVVQYKEQHDLISNYIDTGFQSGKNFS